MNTAIVMTIILNCMQEQELMLYKLRNIKVEEMRSMTLYVNYARKNQKI